MHQEKEKNVPFFRLSSLLPKIKNINDILFLVFFTYTRIYLFSKDVIFSNNYNTNIKLFNPNVILYNIYNLTIYSLYALNVYWFLLICKSIFKQICNAYKELLSAKNCEYILQYTYILSLFCAIYKYSYYVKDYPIYYLDILGYVLVSLSSYLYHNALYKKITNTNSDVDVLESGLIGVYLFDIGCINVRTWLNGYVHFNMVAGLLSEYKNCILIGMGIIHFISYFIYCYFIIDLKNKKQTFTLHCRDYKIIIINILIGVPILLNMVLGCINANNIISYYLYLNLYVNALILFIKPFYQLNHIAIHISLVFMSIGVVNLNI